MTHLWLFLGVLATIFFGFQVLDRFLHEEVSVAGRLRQTAQMIVYAYLTAECFYQFWRVM